MPPFSRCPSYPEAPDRIGDVEWSGKPHATIVETAALDAMDALLEFQ